MNRPTLLLWTTRIWLALATTGLFLGVLRPPGLQGIAEARSWWTARRFEQAGLERNLFRMAALGQDLLREQRQGAPAEFAGYLLAWAAPTPSMGYRPAEAAALAEEGRNYLEKLLDQLPAPWASLQILSNSLVLRPILGQSAEETALGLTLHATWMAAGGGLLDDAGAAAGSGQTAAAYRQMIRLPLGQRMSWLAQRLQTDGALAPTTTEQALQPVFGNTAPR